MAELVVEEGDDDSEDGFEGPAPPQIRSARWSEGGDGFGIGRPRF